MTTLGSWIDAETVSGLGKELTTPAIAGSTLSGGTLPLTKLSADDFRLPGNYHPAPFPGPDNEERDKVREMLRNVRRRAEETGLVGKTGADLYEGCAESGCIRDKRAVDCSSIA